MDNIKYLYKKIVDHFRFLYLSKYREKIKSIIIRCDSICIGDIDDTVDCYIDHDEDDLQKHAHNHISKCPREEFLPSDVNYSDLNDEEEELE